ncbi:hypothetical protein WMY93_022900 [Mugilogobius chulae]|uniref:Uncharacterized protein n=1 Tax=Mugilogobius chulae TaxID=88201 RepID=A0AAW0N788_9GOBI
MLIILLMQIWMKFHFLAIKQLLDSMGEHVGLLEQRVGKNEDNVHELQVKIEKLEKQNVYLLEKVDDLENRSRASNLHFIGIPEAAEGRDVLGFMTQLIPQLLGRENFPFPPTIERAHRSPTITPLSGFAGARGD